VTKETQPNMKTLLDDIQKASGIDQLKAELALGAMLEFLSRQLPSPVMGRIKDVLSPRGDVKDLGNAGK
jgi:hypothetical protein